MPLPAGVPDDSGASDASGMGSAPETDHSDTDDQEPGQRNPAQGPDHSNPNTVGPGHRNSNYNADEDDADWDAGDSNVTPPTSDSEMGDHDTRDSPRHGDGHVDTDEPEAPRGPPFDKAVIASPGAGGHTVEHEGRNMMPRGV